MRFLVLLIVVLWCGVASGQDPIGQLLLEQVGTADPNGTGRVRVIANAFGTDADPIAGISAVSLGVTYNSSLLSFIAVNPVGELSAINGGGGPDFLNFSEHADGIGLVVGMLTELVPPWDIIVPSGPILEIVFAVSPAAAGTTVAVGLQTITGVSPPFNNMIIGVPLSDPSEAIELDPNDFQIGLEISTQFPFMRGDSENDGDTDLQDVLATLDAMFLSGTVECPSAMDSNGDGSVSIVDPIAFLEFMFASGPPLAEPHGQCGNDDIGMDCAPGACP